MTQQQHQQRQQHLLRPLSLLVLLGCSHFSGGFSPSTLSSVRRTGCRTPSFATLAGSPTRPTITRFYNNNKDFSFQRKGAAATEKATIRTSKSVVSSNEVLLFSANGEEEKPMEQKNLRPFLLLTRLIRWWQQRLAAGVLRNVLAFFSGWWKRRSHSRTLLWTRGVRKQAVLVLAATVFWLGAARLQTPPAVASSTTSMLSVTAPIEHLLEKTSPSLEQMIDRYVKEHMFADDRYDPVESLYREAYDDATTGRYPHALREVTSDVWGQLQSTGTELAKAEPASTGGGGIGPGTLLNALRQRGWSDTAAIALLASLAVVAGPTLFLVMGMVVGGMSKRKMNSVFKQRYGDTYTVDATVRKEEEVEAPPDEEDEDNDDEEEEDDDDDDNDDEDEDDKTGKKKK